MRVLVLLFLFCTIGNLSAQEKITHLQYGKMSIAIPEDCSTESAYGVSNCKGFSVQWLYLSEEMVEQGVHVEFAKQARTQLDFTQKKSITFTSQGQLFKGDIYLLANGATRIIAFGRITDMPLLLNLGFDKEPKTNADFSDFEKNFIMLKQ